MIDQIIWLLIKQMLKAVKDYDRSNCIDSRTFAEFLASCLDIETRKNVWSHIDSCEFCEEEYSELCQFEWDNHDQWQVLPWKYYNGYSLHPEELEIAAFAFFVYKKERKTPDELEKLVLDMVRSKQQEIEQFRKDREKVIGLISLIICQLLIERAILWALGPDSQSDEHDMITRLSKEASQSASEGR